MKAAVLHSLGGIPRYEDFPDPVPTGEEVLVDVKAVAVENVDRAIAAGTHYTAGAPELPSIPCFDGIGALPDGTLVGFGNLRAPYGALAERAAVSAYGPIPDGVDPAVAAVMSSAITGMSMRMAAALKPGETVLVQGPAWRAAWRCRWRGCWLRAGWWRWAATRTGCGSWAPTR